MLHLEQIEIREKIDEKLICAKLNLQHILHFHFSSNKHADADKNSIYKLTGRRAELEITLFNIL